MRYQIDFDADEKGDVTNLKVRIIPTLVSKPPTIATVHENMFEFVPGGSTRGSIIEWLDDIAAGLDLIAKLPLVERNRYAIKAYTALEKLKPILPNEEARQAHVALTRRLLGDFFGIQFT